MFQALFLKIIKKFSKDESTKFSKTFTTILLIIGIVVLFTAFVITIKNGSLVETE